MTEGLRELIQAFLDDYDSSDEFEDSQEPLFLLDGAVELLRDALVEALADEQDACDPREMPSDFQTETLSCLRDIYEQLERLTLKAEPARAPYVLQTHFVFPNGKKQLLTPGDVYQHVRPAIEDQPQEHLVLVCLDTKNHPIHTEVLCKGTVNAVLYHPRDIFRVAVRHNAVSIALCHCHPSGDVRPSSDDIDMTKRVSECATLMDIPLLDHLIVGKETFFAFSTAYPEIFPRHTLPGIGVHPPSTGTVMKGSDNEQTPKALPTTRTRRRSPRRR